MKSFIIGFFIFLIWFCAGSWVYTCKIKSFCTENQKIKSSKNVMEETLSKHAITNENITAKDTETNIYNKVLYFEFDSERHKTDQELKRYIANLKAYLNADPGKKLHITGHTDNVGEAEDNKWIGMQRAKNAMKYLISQGVPEKRIQVFSKGETEPIAPNTTTEGRKRNRRVEITVN